MMLDTFIHMLGGGHFSMVDCGMIRTAHAGIVGSDMIRVAHAGSLGSGMIRASHPGSVDSGMIRAAHVGNADWCMIWTVLGWCVRRWWNDLQSNEINIKFYHFHINNLVMKKNECNTSYIYVLTYVSSSRMTSELVKSLQLSPSSMSTLVTAVQRISYLKDSSKYIKRKIHKSVAIQPSYFTLCIQSHCQLSLQTIKLYSIWILKTQQTYN